jgi:hypothetical protein
MFKKNLFKKICLTILIFMDFLFHPYWLPGISNNETSSPTGPGSEHWIGAIVVPLQCSLRGNAQLRRKAKLLNINCALPSY